MLRLALPVLLEQFLGILVIYSDTILAGQYLGEADLAAMSLMAYVMWLLPSLFAVVAIGATAMTARFVGAGEMRWALRATNQAVLIGVWLAGGVMLLLGLFGQPLIEVMNLGPDAAPKASLYLKYMLPVIPAIMLTQVGPACLHGAGDTVSGMAAMSVVNVVNIAVSWSLVTGLAGLPRLGWEGLAIGASLGHGAGGLIILGLLLRGRAGLKLQRRLFAPTRGSFAGCCASVCPAAATRWPWSFRTSGSCRSSSASATPRPRRTVWPCASNRWPICRATPFKLPPPRWSDNTSAPRMSRAQSAPC